MLNSDYWKCVSSKMWQHVENGDNLARSFKGRIIVVISMKAYGNYCKLLEREIATLSRS